MVTINRPIAIIAQSKLTKPVDAIGQSTPEDRAALG